MLVIQYDTNYLLLLVMGTLNLSKYSNTHSVLSQPLGSYELLKKNYFLISHVGSAGVT